MCFNVNIGFSLCWKNAITDREQRVEKNSIMKSNVLCYSKKRNLFEFKSALNGNLQLLLRCHLKLVLDSCSYW